MNTEYNRLARDWESEALYKVQHGDEYSTPWNYYTDDIEDAIKVARFCVEEMRDDYAEVLKKDETPGRYISIVRLS